MLRGACLPDSIGETLLDVTACLLVTSHSKLAVESTSKLLPSVSSIWITSVWFL